MRTFYSGSPEVMERLGRFLKATLGKQLVVMCDDANNFYGDNYVEFEVDGEDAHSATDASLK